MDPMGVGAAAICVPRSVRPETYWTHVEAASGKDEKAVDKADQTKDS